MASDQPRPNGSEGNNGNGSPGRFSYAAQTGQLEVMGPDRIPVHPPPLRGFAITAPFNRLLMTPHVVAIGGMLCFFTVVLMVVVLPITTYQPPPSLNWLPLSNAELRGRATYLANQCWTCHSGYSRPQDTFIGQYYLYPRVSEPGDFWGGAESPNIFGSERTGPDLSQEGGNHPDEWHVAHYANPRNPQPLSIMPSFAFFTVQELADTIAFNQAQGGKEAALRYAAVTVANRLMLINQGQLDPLLAFPDLVRELQQTGEYNPTGQGTDMSPWGLPWKAVWMINNFERGYWLTNDPLALTEQNLAKGKYVFLDRCVGCHGINGAGNGPAASFFEVKPFDFTDPSMSGPMGPFGSDGMFYYRMLIGGHGTSMEPFGTRLSVEDMWRVVLFLRTIRKGSMATQDTIPTLDMWEQWKPPPPLLNYVKDHPISDAPGVISETESNPFKAAARWVEPGLADGDVVLDGGKLPITVDRITQLVRATYFDMVERKYREALARGDTLPPRDQVFSTVGMVFHEP